MRYLLDVNAMIAFGLDFHALHERTARWVEANPGSTFLTCSITELGFIRVVAQVPEYSANVEQAILVLKRLKSSPLLSMEFVSDSVDAGSLPPWVLSGARVTDGHLVQLAAAHKATLATLDAGIPGAFLIPDHKPRAGRSHR